MRQLELTFSPGFARRQDDEIDFGKASVEERRRWLQGGAVGDSYEVRLARKYLLGSSSSGHPLAPVVVRRIIKQAERLLTPGGLREAQDSDDYRVFADWYIERGQSDLAVACWRVIQMIEDQSDDPFSSKRSNAKRN